VEIQQSADKTKAGSTQIVRTAFASFVGTLIEWYDFFLFGTASALIFNKVFFTNLDPVAGTLASFAAFGVAFVARPVGAVLFGHFGDRIGRKRMLVASLLLMGLGTIVVGALPTYETIGLLAPVLLVLARFMQGLAVGGEWGGAVLMAVEHAPRNRRAFYGSWPQVAVPVALVLATLSFLAVRQLPEEAFMSWGWRLPFLASVVLMAVGLYIRLNILESPVFTQMKSEGKREKLPVGALVKNHWRRLLIGLASVASANIPFYLATVFVIKYAQDTAGVSGNFMLIALSLAAIAEAIMIPIAAITADRVGPRNVLLVGSIVVVVLAFPFFWLIDTGSHALIVLALVLILGLGHALTYSPTAGFLSELFPANVRYTGTSVAYHLGGAVTSGPVPFVAAALVALAGSAVPLSWYIAVAGAISIIAMLCVKSDRPGKGTETTDTVVHGEPAATVRT
jgi:metabolite-proton symporter